MKPHSVMTVVPFPQFFAVAAIFSAASTDSLRFDPSNPKILIGLVIGGSIPYFIPAIPAVLTKWLLFRTVPRLAARPKFSRLCAVGITEVFCFLVMAMASGWLRSSIPLLIGLAPLTLLNLLLFQTADQHYGWAGYHLLRRSLYALGMGLLYFGYAFLTGVILSFVLHRT